MKKLVTGILLFMVFPVTMAMTESQLVMCNTSSELAYNTMMARQEGASMPDLWALAVKSDSVIEEQIVENAYDVTRYHSPEMQSRAAKNYRDLWFQMCIKAMKD